MILLWKLLLHNLYFVFGIEASEMMGYPLVCAPKPCCKRVFAFVLISTCTIRPTKSNDIAGRFLPSIRDITGKSAADPAVCFILISVYAPFLSHFSQSDFYSQQLTFHGMCVKVNRYSKMLHCLTCFCKSLIRFIEL